MKKLPEAFHIPLGPPDGAYHAWTISNIAERNALETMCISSGVTFPDTRAWFFCGFDEFEGGFHLDIHQRIDEPGKTASPPRR